MLAATVASVRRGVLTLLLLLLLVLLLLLLVPLLLARKPAFTAQCKAGTKRMSTQ